MTQGMLMGSVTVVITALLLLLMFFDHPHGDGVGRLQPTAMERTLRLDRHPGRGRRPRRRRLPVTSMAVPLTTAEAAGRSWQELLVTVLLVVAALARRGAATRPRDGTASRRPRRAAPTRSGSRRPGPTGWRGPRPRSTSPPSSPGPTRTSAARRGRRLLRRPLPRRVPAGVRRVDGDRPARRTPTAPPTPFAMAGVPASPRREGGASSTRPPRRRPPRCAWTSSAPATTC